MNKDQIIKCVKSSIRLIEAEMSDHERDFVREHLELDGIMAFEALANAINSPGNHYHSALELANNYCDKYRIAVKKLRARYKRVGAA